MDALEEAKQQHKESVEDLSEAEREAAEWLDDGEEEDTDQIDSLKMVLANNKAAYVDANHQLYKWREEHSATMQSIQDKCNRLQKRLKALCSR